MKTKKKYKSFILCFVLMLSLLISPFANTTTALAEENDFKIMGTVQNDKNNIRLDWTALQSANYQLYQSIDGGEFQTMSTFDVENGTDKVKVLQIYPHTSATNQLKTWLITNGYGKGIMEIDSVYIDNYNTNPYSYLQDSEGNWKYDVIFFGTWDSNASKDLNSSSVNATKEFINTGRGCIFGHDTLSCGTNFKKLDTYLGVTPDNTLYSGNTSKPNGVPASSGLTSTVKIVKKGLFTTYPWDIGEIGTILTIPATHTNQQTTTSDVWLRFYLPNYSTSDMVNPNNIYLITKNNVALIQTGHSSGQATVDEQKILANLIFYCDQITNETSYVDNSGQDFALPNTPKVKIDANNGKLLLEATDNGTTYSYKAKAYVDGETIESDPISVENKSGIKGYYYLVSTNANDKVMNANGTFVESGTIDLTALPIMMADTTYLHIASVDNANNVSETTTINLDDIIGINASNIVYTINTVEDTTNVDLSIVASGSNINYQWEMKSPTTNNEWEEISGATTDEYSMDITSLTDSIFYRCRVYNSTLSMYSNEVVVNPLDYDKTFVYVTQASTFSVIIPKTIILDGSSGLGEYQVQTKGNVSGTASLSVVPNEFAIMKDVAGVKTSFNASVTQNKTLFNSNEIINNTITNGIVDASQHMTAGNWKGTFNFVITFSDENAKVNSIGSVNQYDDGINVGYDKEQDQSTAYSNISFVN